MSADVPNGARRFTLATVAIRANRTLGYGRPNEEVLREKDYRDEPEFWSDALSDALTVSALIRRLEDFVAGPLVGSSPTDDVIADPNRLAEWKVATDRQDADRMTLRGLIKCFRDAYRVGEPWLVRDPLLPEDAAAKIENMIVRSPRDAVSWIASRPRRRHLLPPGLRAFLAPAVAPERTRVRGRPNLMTNILPEMNRRHETEEALSLAVEEARHLRSWFTKQFPNDQPPSLKTIKNAIGDMRGGRPK